MMASIAREKNGHRRILFFDADDKRKTIRVGRVPQRSAETIRFRVEQLAIAKRTGQALEVDTVNWVASLDLAMARKLARVGLIPDREAKTVTMLGDFLTTYLDSRADLKSATKIVRRQVIQDLNGYFGQDRDVQSVTPGDADDF